MKDPSLADVMWKLDIILNELRSVKDSVTKLDEKISSLDSDIDDLKK